MKLSNKVRFILAVISGELKVNNRRKADIEQDMDHMQFRRIPPAKKVMHMKRFDPALLPGSRSLSL